MQGHPGEYQGNHQFTDGLTLIHGANEAGKSLRFELIQFALFGSKALREPLSKYKKVDTTLNLVVKDEEYTIVRSKSTAKLLKGKIEVAVGTSPVNDAVLNIFGYNMEVFNIANICRQDKITELSSMKPAQRKALVDNVVGLGVVDDIIKDLNGELRDLRSQLKGMSELNEPVKPVILGELLSDLDYETFITKKEKHLAAVRLSRELTTLESTIPDAGKPPLQPSNEVYENAERYKKVAEGNRAYNKVTTALNGLSYVDVPYSLQELNDLKDQWAVYEAGKSITCPECDTEFHPAGVEEPTVTKREIQDYISQINVNRKYETLKAEPVKLVDITVFADARELVEEYNRNTKVYEQTLRKYEDVIKRIEVIKSQPLSVDIMDNFEQYQQAFNETTTYKRLEDQYNSFLIAYTKTKTRREELEEEIQDYVEIISALKRVKVKVKGYLVPSLNKVASSYLSTMTDGFRNTIIISEDFEIRVDGQGIEALSGSAKSIANLAIRLALGQTLTNSVFSVFMADEIDGSMDADRVEYTAKCLRNLTSRVNQVILISHKKIEADNYLELTR